MGEFDLEVVKLERPQGRVKNVYRGPGVAFVPHPHINGAWMKVHPCVVDRHCPVCGVTPGALCIFNPGRHTTSHHYVRNRGALAGQPEKQAQSVTAKPDAACLVCGSTREPCDCPSGVEIPPPAVELREEVQP